MIAISSLLWSEVTLTPIPVRFNLKSPAYIHTLSIKISVYKWRKWQRLIEDKHVSHICVIIDINFVISMLKPMDTHMHCGVEGVCMCVRAPVCYVHFEDFRSSNCGLYARLQQNTCDCGWVALHAPSGAYIYA